MYQKGDVIEICGQMVHVIGRHMGNNVRVYFRNGELRTSMGYFVSDTFVRNALAELVPKLLKRQEKRPEPTPLPKPDKATLVQWEAELMAWLPERYAYWCEKMGVEGVPMTIKPLRSCWGKYYCKDKRIVFSTYLALKPREFAEETIVHELAHHFVPNHSKAFHDLMKKYVSV